MSAIGRDVRMRLLRTVRILVFACLAADFGFFILYVLTESEFEPIEYLLVRVVTPFLLNLFSWVLAYSYNKRDDVSDSSKNSGVAYSITAICGVMAIFHGYFTPLWCLPGIAFIFSSLFRERKILLRQYICSFVIALLAAIQIIHEYPKDISYYLQTLAVVYIVNFLFYLFAKLLFDFYLKISVHYEEMIRQQADYLALIRHDNLTGTYSRVYLEELAKTFIEVNKDKSLIICMIDLDDFKSINDTYGHKCGDDVLKYMGRLLIDACSNNIQFGRYGGEEFVGVFCDTSMDEAVAFVNRLRERLHAKKFDFSEMQCSFSAGITLRKDGESYADALNRADDAMYISKLTGKNRVTQKN